MKKVIPLSILTLIMMSFMSLNKNIMYESVNRTIQDLEKQFDLIPEDRKKDLNELAMYIERKVHSGEKVDLTFICTHNSRRSHISQIWAQTSAAYYGIPNVQCYSGGTEATAFNPRAVKAMKTAGFHITQKSNDSNPVYAVSYSDAALPVMAYSKKYDDLDNPQQNFGAIMTCSHADANCPIVRGAEKRFSIPYEDPKAFDGTSREEEMYNERVQQIGREMLYAFSMIKGN